MFSLSLVEKTFFTSVQEDIYINSRTDVDAGYVESLGFFT